MMSASSSPRPTPSSNLTANSIASIRLKYVELSGAREPGAIAAARPDGQAQPVGAGERRICGEERIGGADVEPDPPAERERRVDDVVAREVRRVVERSRGRLAAGAPERRRVAPDGAEPPRVQAREVERAE